MPTEPSRSGDPVDPGPTNQSGRPGRLDGMTNLPGSGLRSRIGAARRSRWDLLAVLPLALVAFAVVAAVAPPRSGPLALALVLEVYLFILTFAVLAPIALLARARLLGAALLLLVMVMFVPVRTIRLANMSFAGRAWIRSWSCTLPESPS